MRLLEWFRFGKRIDEMGKEVERFKRKTEASHSYWRYGSRIGGGGDYANES